jgi:hypothetical protein
MPISSTMQSALVAAALGAGTATMLAAVVLPGWADTAVQPTAVSIVNFTFTPQTLTVAARQRVWETTEKNVISRLSDFSIERWRFRVDLRDVKS